MKQLIVIFLSFSVVFISSCKNQNTTTKIKKDESVAVENKHESEIDNHKDKKHWSYEGETSPENWAEIEKDSDCGGMSQSPINITVNDVTESSSQNNLKILYSRETKLNKVVNNGHSIQFDFDKGDSINYNDKIYQLIQLHLHEPSEHTINGVRYPIEIHLVHKSNQGELTVLSVLGEEGKESEFFEFFESFLPIENGKSKIIDHKLPLIELQPKKRDYYSYSGSLTTPPCSENVNWIIFKNQMQVSHDEIMHFKENMPLNNYRNVQAINDRTVYLNK